MACHRRGSMPSLQIQWCWILISMIYVQVEASRTFSTAVDFPAHSGAASLPSSDPGAASLPSSDPGCGRPYFTENSGVITSPQYPQDYPNNMHCIYTIRRPHGSPMLLQSTSFRLEYMDGCYFDYVKIFAGPLSDTYDGIFCGNNTIYYATSSDLVTIEFRSDGAITGSGFRIEFGHAHSTTTATTTSTTVPTTTSTSSASCGRTMFRENSGVINSPNYPGQYPYDVHCFYTIHRYSSAPTLLRSQTFSLERQSSCFYDYVKVYTASSPGISAEPVGVYCGTRTINLVLHGRYITVEFQSDDTVTGNGFQLMFGDANSTTTVTTTTRSTTSAGTTTGSTTATGSTTSPTSVCGDTLYHENSDDIFSPNYPDLYPDNAHCIYTIHRSSSTPTLLRSIYFHLEYQRSCYYDYVKIYTGSSPGITSEPVGVYCGTQTINLVLHGRYITVEFRSDDSARGVFQLQFGDAIVIATTLIPYLPTTNILTADDQRVANASDSRTAPLIVESSLAFIVVVIAVLTVGALIVHCKKGDRRSEPSSSSSNPLFQESVNVPTGNEPLPPAVQYQPSPATMAVPGLPNYNWSGPPPYDMIAHCSARVEDNWIDPPPYDMIPHDSAPVEDNWSSPPPYDMIANGSASEDTCYFSAQPSSPAVADPKGGYINPVYALATQNENNDSCSTTSAAVAAGDAVAGGIVGGTVSGGMPGGAIAGGTIAADTADGDTAGRGAVSGIVSGVTVAGGTAERGTVAGLSGTDVQP